MLKLNCWEFKKSGRQPGGGHISDLGVCPAAQDDILQHYSNGIILLALFYWNINIIEGNQLVG